MTSEIQQKQTVPPPKTQIPKILPSQKTLPISSKIKIGIIGLGFVGEALHSSFTKHNITSLRVYDKYKNGGIGSPEKVLDTDLLFLCLPTPFIQEKKDYDLQPIHETCQFLQQQNYQGLVVIKSTVTPTTCDQLANQYYLKIVHNPEFLTARTAKEDFHNQRHIVLGRTNNIDNSSLYHLLINFYQFYYPEAEITECTSGESEAMKIYVNSFYAIKIQAFNEFYQLSKKLSLDNNKITEMMLKNGWINPMHTQVPGTDGHLSYGGGCFPKDTQALLHKMKQQNTPHQVLESVIQERNFMRSQSHKN